ncbi:hypothetical protein TNCV_4265621 [Trichonephila clavipes]|nr:hypothetical protein TNCV_4265621 [Trichonephila clavipes]
MSNTLNVNEVSKAHLGPKEQEIELQAVKNHCEELLDFNTELKENIDRILKKAKENIRHGATTHEGQGLLCPSQYTPPWTLRCMSGCSGQKIPEGSELASKVTNDAKMVAKVAKLTANLVAKNDANLALPPRFRQVLIQSPL